MTDRIVEGKFDHAPEIPDVLERVLVFCLDEAKGKFEEAGGFNPFTATAVKDKLFIEEIPGEEPEECYARARHTVQDERGAEAYGFCYDGYVDLDNGSVDAVIAEGGVPGDLNGYAIGIVYRVADDGTRTFEAEPTYIGKAPNFMALTNTKTFAEEQAEAQADAATAEQTDEGAEGGDQSEAGDGVEEPGADAAEAGADGAAGTDGVGGEDPAAEK